MMNIQLHKIVNQATTNALERLSTDTIVPKTSVWPLAKLISKIRSEVELWEKTRQNVLKKYGKVENDQIEVFPDKVKEANEELNTILQAEVELPLNEPVKVSKDIPAGSGVTAQDLGILLSVGLITEE